MSEARWLATCFLLFITTLAGAADASRLDDIRARGALSCGIWPHVAGFAIEHDGRYEGFEVDLCRAFAAAILGDATKVRFVPVEHISEFVERKDVDLAVRRLTWTPSRETESGTVFGPVVFYDGQGFLVAKESGIQSAAQLGGERVCVINQEHHPRTLLNYFRTRNQEIQLVMLENDKQAEDALRSGRCRAYSADISWLAAARSGFTDGLTRYQLLPERISKEPLAPLMRAEDIALAQVVRWTIFALVEAEESGLSSHNIESAGSSSPQMRALISGVGNYGELYDRNLGARSKIQLDRGLNGLWSQGGLMYAPPLDR